VSRPTPPRTPASGEPGSRLYLWGMRGWLFTGIALAALVLASALAQVSGLVVPLVVATVLGALFAPVVDGLERHRIPRPVGGFVVIALLGGVAAFSLWLVLVGVADQARQISSALTAGVETLQGWLSARGVTTGGGSVAEQLGELAPALVGGASAYLPGLLSGTVAFALGIAIGTFMVYYILTDWHTLTAWLAGRLGSGGDVGSGIIDDTVGALRRYFSSLTLSAVVTAVLIGASAWALDVPLAFTIAVITLVTSYIPYLGAILSGAFATLVALGAVGTETALVMLVIVLVVQNIVQTVVLTRLTSTSLRLHPIVTLGSTVVGAALAGALGAMLSAPVVAAWVLVLKRLRRADADAQNLHTSGT
jgi:putative heme transporter